MAEVRIRFARLSERTALEALQLRASLIWKEYRAALRAHPDAIAVPEAQIRARQVRVAELGGRAVGFSSVIPGRGGAGELDALFVEPKRMRHGIGRLLIADAVSRARRQGIPSLMVTGNPNAAGFYEKVGFVATGITRTRFGDGIRMRLRIRPVSAKSANNAIASGVSRARPAARRRRGGAPRGR